MGERIDEQGVRERLEDTIEKQFGAKRRKRVQREVRWVIERAGIPWNTFYKKLKGDRRIQDADVPVFARALGLHPLWLATGHGPAPDDRPLEPLVVTVGWAPYKRPRGRPQKHPNPKSQFRLGWRVTGKAQPEPPTRVEVDKMGERLAAMPVQLPEPLSFPRLALLDEFVAVTLAQAEPRRADLKFLLNVAEHLDTQLRNYWPLEPGLESEAEHEHRQSLRLLNELRGELRAALEDLGGKKRDNDAGPA